MFNCLLFAGMLLTTPAPCQKPNPNKEDKLYYEKIVAVLPDTDFAPRDVSEELSDDDFLKWV